MVLSSADRDELIQRVEHKLGTTSVRRAVIRDAVDRTLGALAEVSAEGTGAPTTLVVVAAPVPDLASRLRRAVQHQSIAVEGMASATEGRHTVVILRVAEELVGVLRAAAERIGAHLVTRGEAA